MKMVVLGILGLVPTQHIEDILKYLNGQESMDVNGMKMYINMLQREVILRFLNGQ